MQYGLFASMYYNYDVLLKLVSYRRQLLKKQLEIELK